MLAKFKPRLSYANVTATLALVMALSGTAYAAATITGAEVVDESLTGADVRGTYGTSTTAAVNGSLTGADIGGQPANAALSQPAVAGSLSTYDIKDATIGAVDLAGNSVTSAKVADNSLTGADINESTLGKVPDADKLDGIDSTGFIQGRGSVLSNRIVRDPDGIRVPLLDIPGLGQLTAQCAGNYASVQWSNTTSANIDVWSHGTDAAGKDGFMGFVAPPGGGVLVAFDNTTEDVTDGATIEFGQGDDPGPRKIATVHVFAFQSADNARCGFQAQATVWTS